VHGGFRPRTGQAGHLHCRAHRDDLLHDRYFRSPGAGVHLLGGVAEDDRAKSER
jgi:hypothetical protein